MKKTIFRTLLCLLLAVIIPVSVWAADYTLPEKMDKQLAIGSGLKGSFVLHAAGTDAAVQAMSPFLEKELSLRGMKSGEDAHYYIYQAGENEKQNGLTEVYLKDGVVYFRSDLINGPVLRFPGTAALLDQLVPSGGENPPAASVLAGILMKSIEKDPSWELFITKYADEIELWVTSHFADGQTIQAMPDGASAVELSYTIPIGELKKKMIQLLKNIKANPEEAALVENLMSREQIETYFNPYLDYYYDAAFDAMNHEFDVVVSRTVSTMGEELSSGIELPLDARVTGYSALKVHKAGKEITVSLSNERETLALIFRGDPADTASMHLMRYPAPENTDPVDRMAMLWTLHHTVETSTDEETRDHQTEVWTLTAKRDVSRLPEGEKEEDYPETAPMRLDVKLHYFSKFSQSSPTTLEVDGALETGGLQLRMEGAFKTASPWIFSPFAIDGAQDFLSLSEEQKLLILGEALLNAATQLEARPEADALPADTPETEAPTTEPAAEPAPESVPDPTAEPVSESVPDPTAEPAS